MSEVLLKFELRNVATFRLFLEGLSFERILSFARDCVAHVHIQSYHLLFPGVEMNTFTPRRGAEACERAMVAFSVKHLAKSHVVLDRIDEAIEG